MDYSIIGSKMAPGRFGTAIAVLGDINGDEYPGKNYFKMQFFLYIFLNSIIYLLLFIIILLLLLYYIIIYYLLLFIYYYLNIIYLLNIIILFFWIFTPNH